MNIDKFTVNVNASLIEALKTIDRCRSGFVIVLDDNESVCGTLTDGDIRRALIRGIDVQSKVNDVYNTSFVQVDVADSFETVVQIFKEPTIKFIPITDSNNRLINIITRENLHVILMENIDYSSTYNFLGIDNRVLEHEIYMRPWGYYKSTFLNAHAQSKILKVRAGGVLSLQKHFRRNEYWVVISGAGEVTIDDQVFPARAGDFFYIPAESKHRLKNISKDEALMISEVQLGDYFGEDDIVRYDDDYGRL